MNKKKPKKVNPIPSIIPAAIFNNENLSDGAKVFYGVVVFLARETGVAFAGTRYLSTQLGRSTRSIQYYISELYEKNIIDVEIKDGKRNIYPSIIPLNSSDVASFIPPEIVKRKDVSAAVKLTYGLIQFKSANVNQYFAVKGIDELTELTNKSRSTMYRHLKIYKRLKLVRWEKIDTYTRLFTFNSYQDVIKYKNNELKSIPGNDPPEDIKPTENKITPEIAQQLSSLISRPLT